MACGRKEITIEKVWNGDLPFTVYKLPSGYDNKVIVVYEDPTELTVELMTEEEYKPKIKVLTNCADLW